MMKCVVE